MANEPLDPIMAWLGGKRWQLPAIASLYAPHAHRRLVEPFAGGLAISLGLRPVRVWANDLCGSLMMLYRAIREGLTITIPMENTRECYDASRERFNALNTLLHFDVDCEREVASLFYYLNRTGFNGLCRFNAKGGYNVPFGRRATITYRRTFEEHQAAFRAWDFSCLDVRQMRFAPDDFIYADPPYDDGFTAYTPGGFSWHDQEALAEQLAAHSGPVVVCNAWTERIVALYQAHGFETEPIAAPLRIGRGSVIESRCGGDGDVGDERNA